MVDKREKDEKRRKKNDNTPDAEPGLDAGYFTGYETDAASTRTKLKKKKTKLKKASGDGYETDDGSSHPPLRKSKSKSRFFKLGNRSKSNVDGEEPAKTTTETPPPLPAPAFRLPIAAKFATTLNLDVENAVLEPPTGPLGLSRSQSPTVASMSPSLPSSESATIHNQNNGYSEDVESLAGIQGLSMVTANTTGTDIPNKRPIIRFASDSSDNHGTTSSSNGHSFLSRLTNGSSSSASTTGSVTSPVLKSLNISYPLTRSPSPPSPPINTVHMVAPVPSIDRSNTKRAPRPLFLNRIPSSQKKFGSRSTPNSSDNSPSDWSPAGSPFVVLTPNPAGSSAFNVRPGLTSAASGSTNSANTVTRLHIPSPHSLRARDVSPAGPTRDIMPSTEFIVPSPSNELFVPPNSLGHYDIPPPSPPPNVPLPNVPADAGQQHGRGQGFDAQQQSHLAIDPPTRSSSPSNLTQRGRVSPFPTRPVQSNGVATLHSSPNRGFESRVRVNRYRDIYAMPPPVGGWKSNFSKESGYASSPETPSNSKRHARQSTKVGIHVEQPSDSEDDVGSDEDLRNVIRGFTNAGRSASTTGHERNVEPEAALDRRKSLETLQNYYNSYDVGRPRKKSFTRATSPRPSFSPSVSEEDMSDDKSRYTSDDKHSMYKMTNPSQARSLASGWADDNRWSMSVDGESRASFMDAEKSDEARERFIKRIEAMFDENGRELPPNLGIGRNAVIPPVPKIPQGFQGGSSKTWI
ncbi:hypothetical protein J3R30DRAFT_3694150 [Lentinula aciculospora]|uniref:Uncharacterized protein n=1 Tax=Lentinula aciculospora TaxID=153920 RepID=A0A9W9DY36_9AGAR|nr:hypothetical protein J3R30DRAFT_3694150 [Lentinula aciculospora]